MKFNNMPLMLNDSDTKALSVCLKKVFADGYGFQNAPYREKNFPSVEVYIKKMTDEKARLIGEAMRLLGISFSRPCGVTVEIFRPSMSEVQDIKRILACISGVEPSYDEQNFAVCQ